MLNQTMMTMMKMMKEEMPIMLKFSSKISMDSASSTSKKKKMQSISSYFTTIQVFIHIISMTKSMRLTTQAKMMKTRTSMEMMAFMIMHYTLVIML